MKAIIYFAEGYEEVEAIATVDVLRRAKIEVIMVGIDGKIIESSRGIKINMDMEIEQVTYEDVDLLVIPGGMPGVSNLEKNEKVKKSLENFNEEGKLIGAICAAPSLLGKLGILKGKKATCYPGFEMYLKDAEYCDEKVVVDANIITAKGAGVSLDFAYSIVEIMKGKELAKELRKAMIA
ncbi:MAG: DJ-1 family glyoxalase III [Cellulosilyticaceae bacterium]